MYNLHNPTHGCSWKWSDGQLYLHTPPAFSCSGEFSFRDGWQSVVKCITCTGVSTCDTWGEDDKMKVVSSCQVGSTCDPEGSVPLGPWRWTLDGDDEERTWRFSRMEWDDNKSWDKTRIAPLDPHCFVDIAPAFPYFLVHCSWMNTAASLPISLTSWNLLNSRFL